MPVLILINSLKTCMILIRRYIIGGTMRKNFGTKAWMYPMPVLIIATYDEKGVADAMNAAWGCIADRNKVAIYLDSSHKTYENIMKRKAFTVSFANVVNVVECDYVGVVSANQVPNKLDKTNWHLIKSEFVDAPLIEELPMALECTFESFDEESELLIGEIINVCIDETILDESGKVDLAKFKPIAFDTVNHTYVQLGEKVGYAFKDGLKLK